MTILNGDKIEKLLWDSGLDFEHRTDSDGVSSIAVWVGNLVVDISETWQDADDWYLDTGVLMFVVTEDGEQIDEDYHLIASEGDLVEQIASYGD